MTLIVGSGRLASMLLTVLKENNQTYLYGRNEITVEILIQQFPYIKKGHEKLFSQVKDVFLCLPPSAYKPFFSAYQDFFSEEVTFYHMATSLKEKDVKDLVGEKRVVPLKLAGHAAVVKSEGKGLFAVPSHFIHDCDKILNWFPSMNVVVASEEDVLLANQLGTKAAIKMILELTETLKQHQIPPVIAKHTINQTVRGVITGYQTNDLGGFAKKIVEQLTQEGDQYNENG